MTNRILFSAAFLITGLSLATPPAQGAEPDADMRAGARLLVSLEGPMAKRDLKSYCAARNGSPEYAGYVMRACQAFVKNNLKKAEDCSEAAAHLMAMRASMVGLIGERNRLGGEERLLNVDERLKLDVRAVSRKPATGVSRPAIGAARCRER